MAIAWPESETIVWKSDRARAIFSAILAVIMALLALGCAVAFVGALFAEMGLAIRLVTLAVLFCLTLLCAGLASYVARNARGFWKGWVAADQTGIAFDLPRDRSLVHRSPAIEGQYSWETIDRLEARFEGFRSQLLGMMQRTYWLVPKENDRILLFEDRALDTAMAHRRGEAAFEKLIEIGKVPVVDRGIVEGYGGLLGAWFTRPPELDAKKLDEKESSLAWNRARFTGRIAGVAAVIVLCAILLSRLLG